MEEEVETEILYISGWFIRHELHLDKVQKTNLSNGFFMKEIQGSFLSLDKTTEQCV